MDKKPYLTFIPLLVAGLAGAALLALKFSPTWIGGTIAVVCVVSFAAGVIQELSFRRSVQSTMDQIFRRNDTTAGNVVNHLDIPCLLFDMEGRIVWANDAMESLYAGANVKPLVPGMDPASPNKAIPMDYNGRSFQIMNMPVERIVGDRQLTFQYWLDRTEALHYSRLYEEQMPTIGLIQVDNYEDLNADKQFHRSTVLTEVERQISEFVTSIEGVYRRYDNSKFIFIFEAKRLPELEKQRFPLLDSVRSVDTGTGMSVTLSISIGAANRLTASDEDARSGMQLVLGRGGDQAVIKNGTNYSFFGGKRQVTARHSRVKARLFADALHQLFQNADQVFVMGHRLPDMDCVGAGLGLIRCARTLGRKAYFVLDEANPMIETAISGIMENSKYRDCIRTPEQASQMMRTSSVLVVVDTQRESSILDAMLYRQASKTVIIDHHRRPVDALANVTLSYYEAGASSTCEMVTEVLQYFDDTLKLTPFESGAMLAGITTDTKHFAFNTGSRTFDAASYLRRNGADTTTVKLMFQDDMQTYRDRAKVVESAIVTDEHIAIARCPDSMEDSSMIAAQAADELISIKGIDASFVLAQRGEVIFISGRSVGMISVQLILEKLGGGGHQSIAGAQLRDVSMDEAIDKLTESIHSYMKEGNE